MISTVSNVLKTERLEHLSIIIRGDQKRSLLGILHGSFFNPMASVGFGLEYFSEAFTTAVVHKLKVLGSEFTV